MRFYLISDNIDTQMGMRLAGIEGVVVHGEEETSAALNEAIDKKNVAVILITTIAKSQCEELVDKYKLERAVPLIVEIPDRHAGSGVTDSIGRYLKEAVGI